MRGIWSIGGRREIHKITLAHVSASPRAREPTSPRAVAALQPIPHNDTRALNASDPPALLLDLYRVMARIRAFENAAEVAALMTYAQAAALALAQAMCADAKAAGFGAEIVATVAEALTIPVKRLGAPRIPAGYAQPLEDVSRLSVAKIVHAARGFF